MELCKSIHLLSLLFLTLNHLCIVFSNNPYPFLTWDASRIAGKEFDYIVVGGGTAGCSVAVTLSHDFSVLLLERGTSPFGNPDIERGEAFGNPFVYADQYTSIAQIFFSEEGIFNVRARVLGGGTAINGGFYNRASRKMLTVDMGLDEVLANQSYSWVESKIIYKQTLLKPWSIVLRDALLYAGVGPYNGFTLYPLEGTEYSGSIIDDLGKRHVAAELLDYANFNNLVVLLNSTVGRVLFESGGNGVKQRPCGVEFADRNGVRYTASLKKDGLSEVILCAGALGSPQLLMLSGIGPADHLNSLEIPVVLDSPAVGEGIVDNPGTMQILNSSKPLFYGNVQVVGVTEGSHNYVSGGSIYNETVMAHTGLLLQKVAFPNSKGQLRLRTVDPRDNPTVRFNYYSDPTDLQGCVDGARLQGRMYESPAMQNLGYRDPATGNVELRFIGKPLPGDIEDQSAMEEYCRSSFISIYHYHGGCLPELVIDDRNQVNGVDGLRVVDGSTFKASPGTNPQATLMMLGRYKAIKFIEERSSP